MSKGRYQFAKVKGNNRRSFSRSNGISNRVSSSYGEEYRRVSAYVKKRDNYSCQAHTIGLKPCSNRFPPPLSHLLHTHHKVRRAKGGLDHPKNLITLCCDCHLIDEHGRNVDQKITQKQIEYGKKL